MSISLETFKTLAKGTFAFRDIIVTSQDGQTSAKLGNFVVSQSKEANNATMAAFRQALQDKFGDIGIHAFDTVVGARNMLNKSLRACDVVKTISRLETIRRDRLERELQNLFYTSPRMASLSIEDQGRVRAQAIRVLKDIPGSTLNKLNDPHSFSALAMRSLRTAMTRCGINVKTLDNANARGGLGRGETEPAPTAPMGLRSISKGVVISCTQASTGDLVNSGKIGKGVQMNHSYSDPFIFESLKTNGVEPGFIYHKGWSAHDTRSYMADFRSEQSIAKMEELKERDPKLRALCDGEPLRTQIMCAGRAHPAAMAAVAEFVLEEAAKLVMTYRGARRSGDPGAKIPESSPFCALAKAMDQDKFLGDDDIKCLAGRIGEQDSRAALNKAKDRLFLNIRDTVMNIDPQNPVHKLSPVFRHFSERHIMKLDYNENERVVNWKAGSAGSFQRPERVLTKFSTSVGILYRLNTAAGADDISVGAVTEVLANDLSRVAGIPTQDQELVRGEYSDGHPKLMLSSKLAEGYCDIERGYLVDGRIVSKEGQPPPEKLGKYKAFFLVTADRDAIGSHGQNKGFKDGRFFAIDPGHSLEGNAPDLVVADDLSFKDTGHDFSKRFANYSVFDDDTRFAKLQGLVSLRAVKESSAFTQLFDSYRRAFNPEEQGISPAEKNLRRKIIAEIDKKQQEFNVSLQKVLNAGGAQLAFYDALDSDREKREKAVNTISHLEMLTSPTTWTSKNRQVALQHLEVIPETRVPWSAKVEGGNIIYTCTGRINSRVADQIKGLVKDSNAQNENAQYEEDATGTTRITVSINGADRFFNVMSEENVQKLTHPAEYIARKEGGDVLAESVVYVPGK